MKRFLIIAINIILLFATSGVWLVVLIAYAIWNSKKNRSKSESIQIVEPSIKKSFAGPMFAQESAKGAVFAYASSSQGKSLDAPFAIIDLETTGLNHAKHKIIEIAIKRIGRDGNFIDEISTLINPKVSEIGPTFIHHITSEMVEDAPTFKDFAPELLNRLSGSIAVAHHAAFEDKFLGAELGRIGVGVPNIPCVDTLWLSRQVIDLPNYKMATVIDAFGIEEEDAHTALGDVRMLSKLLPLLLKKSNKLSFPVELFISEIADFNGKLKTRVSNLKKGDDGWMANVLKKLPESGQSLTNEITVSYLEMLNLFLKDGKITGEEAKSLAKLAGSSGLGAEQVSKLHKDYFESIEKIALEDGVITPAEKKKMESLKTQLGIL